MRNLPDELVQELLNELQDSGEQHAKAKARMRQLEEQRKIVKAQLMKVGQTVGGLTSGAKLELFAYSHPTYVDLVASLVTAIENEALMDYRRKDAEIRYECWRSLNSNQRAATR